MIFHRKSPRAIYPCLFVFLCPCPIFWHKVGGETAYWPAFERKIYFSLSLFLIEKRFSIVFVFNGNPVSATISHHHFRVLCPVIGSECVVTISSIFCGGHFSMWLIYSMSCSQIDGLVLSTCCCVARYRTRDDVKSVRSSDDPINNLRSRMVEADLASENELKVRWCALCSLALMLVFKLPSTQWCIS